MTVSVASGGFSWWGSRALWGSGITFPEQEISAVHFGRSICFGDPKKLFCGLPGNGARDFVAVKFFLLREPKRRWEKLFQLILCGGCQDR